MNTPLLWHLAVPLYEGKGQMGALCNPRLTWTALALRVDGVSCPACLMKIAAIRQNYAKEES